MNCIILAAGKGTRLQPLTDNIPKPLLEIKGKPILAYTIEHLPDEVTKVIIVVKHLSQPIKSKFGKKWAGKKIEYVDAVSLKGTADMIRQAKKYIKGKTLILMGDDLYKKEDLEELIKQTSEDQWGLLAKDMAQDAKCFGVLVLGKDNTLQAIVERPEIPPTSLVNMGAYVIDERFFHYKLVKIQGGEYGLPQTIVSAADDISIRVVNASFWLPVNTHKDYQRAKEFIH